MLSLLKQILHIGLPALSGFMGLILYDIIDIYWIGKLGSDAVAGVAAAGFIVWALYSIMTVTNGGAASLIARFHGAKDMEKAWDAVVQSFTFSVVIGIGTTILVVPNIELMFKLMGLNPESIAQAVLYFRIMIYGFTIIYLDMLGNVIFNAYGDNKISNVIMFICLAINCVLDPILMLGLCGLPKLGVEGAAYASLIGYTISLTLRFLVLRHKGYIPPFKNFFTTKHTLYWKIAAIGIPNALTALIWSLIYPILTVFITPFGDVHLAAVGICHRLEDFPYHTSNALAIAITTLVGNAVGRNDRQAVDKISFVGLAFGTAVNFLFVLAFICLPEPLMKLFANSAEQSGQELIAAGITYLVIIGYSEIMMGWELMMGGIFTGLGVTAPTLWITIPCTFARIPAAWWLSSAQHGNLGVKGIWIAISVSTALKGIGLMLLYLYKRKSLGIAQPEKSSNVNTI